MLEMLQQMRLAGAEVARDQQAAPAPHAVGRLSQAIAELLLHMRLRTAQEAYRFPVGNAVAQCLDGPAAGEPVRYDRHASSLHSAAAGFCSVRSRTSSMIRYCSAG